MKVNWKHETNSSLQSQPLCFPLKTNGNWIQGEYIRPYHLTKENLATGKVKNRLS